MEHSETERFKAAASSGLEEALKMYAGSTDARVLVQMTAEASACIVILDTVGRRIAARMAEKQTERASGLTEAARAIATHYRFLRTICERRGLASDWAQYEQAMRKIPRTAHNLAAMERIEALEAEDMVLGALMGLLDMSEAVSEGKPPADPKQN